MCCGGGGDKACIKCLLAGHNAIFRDVAVHDVAAHDVSVRTLTASLRVTTLDLIAGSAAISGGSAGSWDANVTNSIALQPHARLLGVVSWSVQPYLTRIPSYAILDSTPGAPPAACFLDIDPLFAPPAGSALHFDGVYSAPPGYPPLQIRSGSGIATATIPVGATFRASCGFDPADQFAPFVLVDTTGTPFDPANPPIIGNGTPNDIHATTLYVTNSLTAPNGQIGEFSCNDIFGTGVISAPFCAFDSFGYFTYDGNPSAPPLASWVLSTTLGSTAELVWTDASTPTSAVVTLPFDPGAFWAIWYNVPGNFPIADVVTGAGNTQSISPGETRFFVVLSDGSVGVVDGSPIQEPIAAEAIVGVDQALAQSLSLRPANKQNVLAFLNGAFIRQGPGQVYDLADTTITWLAGSGTAPALAPTDSLDFAYRATTN